MSDRIQVGGLQVAKPLYDLIRDEMTPGTGIDPNAFWAALAEILRDLAPRNRALLQRRDAIQAQIDTWHLAHRGQPIDLGAYRAFLADIGYLLPEGPDFQVTTANVDPEIATIAGPQLVVPVSNPRYALNAANARWGSLYDALYGTNVLPDEPGTERGAGFNPERGALVVQYAQRFLDAVAPLERCSFAHATGYSVHGGALWVHCPDNSHAHLADASQFAGYRGPAEAPTAILLLNHGLHIELQIDRDHPVGRLSPAGVKDVLLESAITAIQDCEDSVAAVDAEDKVGVYRNWLGLMRGDLTATFDKGSRTIERRLEPDRTYTAPDGGTLTLPGRSLLLVRNVGHLMTTDAVLTEDGAEIPEGILDALVTSLAAIHDLKGRGPTATPAPAASTSSSPRCTGPMRSPSPATCSAGSRTP